MVGNWVLSAEGGHVADGALLVAGGVAGVVPADVERASDEARAFAESAWAPSTRRSYRSQWAGFVAWCERIGVSPLPATPEVVANWIAERATSGKKVATIALGLAAITEAHRMRGYESPRSSSVVRLVWRGVRRSAGVAATEKAPITPTEVRRFVRDAPADLRGLRDRAIILLGLATASRRSELVALDVQDLVFVENGLEVRVRRAKTDQEGRGLTKVVCFGSDPSTCPVRTTKRWLTAASITSGPVFRSVKANVVGIERLDARVVARVTKRAASMCGLDPTRYGGHSLRAGFVSTALKGGASEKDVMAQTGHASAEMVLRYARRLSLWESPAASRLGL